ncbi:MAG: septation protein SpoVG family protein [Candidatus Saelkia tenebricola]|nr:septation protein SpoVG family protein [Candidatus Saelkia tenebricola]
MEITEVKVFPRVQGNKKLRAYVTVTFDNSFVVRNVKVIEGNKGLFVAMPSRKVQRPCSRCRRSNTIIARFCNYCGVALEASKYGDSYDRQQETKDMAHPINQEFRTYMEQSVLEAYEEEVKNNPQQESRVDLESSGEVI